MEPLKIIIAGGRNFSDYAKLRKETLAAIRTCATEFYNCDKIDKDIVTIVSGCANGADTLGERFAKEFDLKLQLFPADWSKGKGAGYARNTEMAKFASDEECNGVLIAFWDGKSRGTKHMIKTAEKCGLRVFVVKY